MNQKRAVEHYKDHELIFTAIPDKDGWRYTISIVTHKGDNSAVHSEQSDKAFGSDTLALQAAASHARQLVDENTSQ
ncbi:MAG: hypothetical protein HKN59_05280 [Gammaproteobacteria bacterium]|nr:hypothetical protein [Gammaproteobacteria bacterium]